MKIDREKGLTFVELLVTMAILVILSGVTVLALNPGRQFSQARNTQRWSHVNTILNAVYQRIADNRGTWSTICGSATVTLPSATTTIGSDAANVNLEECLVPTYTSSLPLDPSVGVATSTGYTIFRHASTTRITVAAPSAELSEYIAVTR